MRYFFTALFCFTIICAHSQLPEYGEYFNSRFMSQPVSSADEQGVNQLLRRAFSVNSDPELSFQLIHNKTSPYGHHLTFEQYFRGVKIYGSQIKVNITKTLVLRSMLSTVFPVNNPVDGKFPSLGDSKNNLTVPEEFLQIENVWFFHEGQLIPAARFEALTKDERYFEQIINIDGEILFERDLFVYSSERDTTAVAKVFNPDPLTTANVLYGAPYYDANDSDIVELNAERIDVTIAVTYDTTAKVFRLENDYVRLREHSDPYVPPVTSDSAYFVFTRSQSGFEDVNAYFHINIYQLYLQSIGFDSLGCYSDCNCCYIDIDTHGKSGNDQSTFISGTNPPRISFGEGGVDDAEDADVIVHEYGHAIMHSAAPGTNTGQQRQALDEGIGDYIAGSYSKEINDFNWEDIFTWDGHNEFWSGRKVVTSKIYPDNLAGNIYSDAVLWSAPLMELYDTLGRELNDKLLFTSAYNYSANMNMEDAARLYLDVDSVLFDYEHYETICPVFEKYGLVDTCKIIKYENEFFHEEEYAISKDTILFRFTHNTPTDFQVDIFNLIGARVYSAEIKNTQVFDFNDVNLSNGIYIVRIRTPEQEYIKKIMKLYHE